MENNEAGMEAGWDDASWWAGAIEEDTSCSLELEGEDGAWARGFLPPPPRPPFLDPTVQTDGLTTCDLCTWASSSFHLSANNTADDAADVLQWSITLIVVSVMSALIGATLMVTLRHCFRRYNLNQAPRYVESGVRGDPRERRCVDGKRRRIDAGPDPGGGGFWCWARRRAGLDSPTDAPASNHYTVDDAYSGVEALYAELDKPVYQNTDADTASPPSSAYYSDLSERTYETVGQQWEMMTGVGHPLTRHHRLAAIAETAPVHSDYV